METSAQLFFAIEDFVPKNQRVSFGELCQKFSQETSLYSDPSRPCGLWFNGEITKPNEALAFLLSISFVRPGWSSNFFLEDILQHIFRMAKNYRFQGKWNRVGEVLQQDFYTLGINGVLSIILKDMSENDFFGNLLPQAYRIVANRLRTKKLYVFVTDLDQVQKPVHRKIRRRGYNDKGSRRPSDKWLPGYDCWIEEQENQKLDNLAFNSIKSPPPRYWFKYLS